MSYVLIFCQSHVPIFGQCSEPRNRQFILHTNHVMFVAHYDFCRNNTLNSFAEVVGMQTRS